MRNYQHWLFLFFLGIALIGCQEDSIVNNPENSGISSMAEKQSAGYINAEAGQVGDRIWKDLNKNGIQDPGEEGIFKVTVGLYNCNDPSFWMGTTTDENGIYIFKDLLPGSYKVRINIPSGWSLSLQNAGSIDTIDSDFIPAIDNKPYTECFELGPGQSDLTRDCGLYPTPLGQIGNRIWKDANKNGIQDHGEEGIFDVQVGLLNCNDPNFWLGAKTDEQGNYIFKDLQPGSYYVRMNIPVGWSLSPQNVGSIDTIDSDFIPALNNKPTTECFELSPGENDLSWDAGLYPTPPLKAQLGDRVWKDSDEDGIQDTGELGIKDVKVELYDCTGIYLNKFTMTNSEGYYFFTDLDAGCYKVKVILPAGYSYAPQDKSTDNSKDSDVNGSGFTGNINLIAGQTDLSWDAGLYPTPLLTARLGDRVWKDSDEDGIQDFAEFGIKDVKVELYNCGGILVHSTYTNYSGYYYFNNLIHGDYKIKFYSPAGYRFTKIDQGTNDEKDSDADPLTGLTKCFTLGAGVKDLKFDAGLYQVKEVLPNGYGYWKTHSKYGPSSYDPTWALIGEDTPFFYSKQTWFQVIKTESEKGNSYYTLAHQYIAARLNEKAGSTVPPEVAASIVKATELFNNPMHTPAYIGGLKSSNPLIKEFLKLAEILEKYNDGKSDDDDDGDDD